MLWLSVNSEAFKKAFPDYVAPEVTAEAPKEKKGEGKGKKGERSPEQKAEGKKKREEKKAKKLEDAKAKKEAPKDDL